jgi:putative methionine-R-sulfoxide reductase with GAF domain
MPKLSMIRGPLRGQTFDFDADTVFIGRSTRNDLQITDDTISRKQIKIFRIGGKFFVEDLRSTNGTLVNGIKIAPGEGFEVGEGDTITIGRSMIRLSEVPAGKTLDVKKLIARQPPGDSKEKSGRFNDRRSHLPKDLELIYKVSQLLKESVPMTQILSKVLEHLFEVLPRVDRAAIILFDEYQKQIKEVIAKSRGDTGNGAIGYSPTVVGRVLQEGKAVRMSNTAYEPDAGLSEDEGSSNIKSILCVPMIIKSEAYGVIYVDSLQEPYGFRKEDLLLLSSLSGSVAFAIENAHLTSVLKELTK